LPHPRTFYSRDIDEITQFVANAPLPIVSKSSEGACGDNVRLIKERSELEKHVAEIFSDKGLQTYFPWIKQKGYVYFQEYISVDRDLRIITIGDKVELAFWRENPNSWKKNIAGGGKINPEEIPESAKQLASDLAVKTGFHWCASDMLMKEEVPYLLEFSSVFGFSRAGNYEKYFESPNAFILKKQAAYLHKLFTNESKK